MTGLGTLKLVLHGAQGLSRWEHSFSILTRLMWSAKVLIRRSVSISRILQPLTSWMVVIYDVVTPSCWSGPVIRIGSSDRCSRDSFI